MSTLIMTTLVASCAFSMFYVYQIRGKARYESFGEYLRKGWPIFTPLNCLLYLFTEKRAQPPIMNMEDFPELQEIQDNWEVIRDEALALHKGGGFESITDPNSASYYDIGFRTFYKYGWTKFYLNWYGYTHQSAQRLCPRTVEILSRIPSVNGAMFSLLPPSGKLTRHLDPVACSLRYHLGLSTPNDERCYINVDGQSHVWHDGEDVLFDVTYLHFVHNDSDKPRLLLMCDIERPMSVLGRMFNWPYKQFLKGSIVPNTNEDKRGIANRLFNWLVPTLEKSKQLKQKNILAYKALKYSVNTLLLFIVLGLIWGIVHLLSSLF